MTDPTPTKKVPCPLICEGHALPNGDDAWDDRWECSHCGLDLHVCDWMGWHRRQVAHEQFVREVERALSARRIVKKELRAALDRLLAKLEAPHERSD